MPDPRYIKLVVEYDGTAYCGWQIQPNGPTVQAALEETIHALTGEAVRVRGASRTDSGVHARGQVAVFPTRSTIPSDRFAHALSTRLPKDIAIRHSEAVSADFDPRRHALRKLYRYRIHNHPIRPALARHTRWHVKFPLDRDAMAAAARLYEGDHDFTSFGNQECNDAERSNLRTLDRSELLVRGDELVYEVEGRSFLYNMVRNLVGTLVDVGMGRFTPDDILRILAARDRAAAGQGAPPHGLCLEWIAYA